MADLRDSDLRGADLEGVDFRGADLRGADLRRAFLTATRFVGEGEPPALITGMRHDGATGLLEVQEAFLRSNA